MFTPSATSNRVPSQGATPIAPHDKNMQELRDHIGKRSVGGRFVAWVKNKDGLSQKEQHYHNLFQKDLKAKLGSDEAVKVLFQELNFSTTKPLSAREMDVVMSRADEYVTAQQDYLSKFKPSADNVKLSPSALALRTSLQDKFQGSAFENRMAAGYIVKALNLKPDQEVTQAHIDLAHKLVQKYEACRGTPLHKELTSPDCKFPEYFGTTFKRVIANGWDPRADLMSTEELIALHAYTQSDYVQINEELRGKRTPLTSFTRTITDLAVQGMNKLPVYEGWTIRGTNLPLLKDLACVPGATVSDEGFTSTSAGKRFPGTHQFMIKSPGGRDVSFLSNQPDELEILYPPNHTFKVVGRIGEIDHSMSIDTGNDAQKASVGSAWITLE
ncbi:ADP-ribosyltransferase domain-containing protein [Verrucomicrobium sp. BvORR106]|uniref:ADP-ribosyltransferase n=1 Tax=Verrucomicrobium sp. BvORR106 TaxID=1403819 RepID=UPI00056F4BE3|nr:ADP-ribosyltransferase domain-containing protein [Verrucomicrobium sp. BvORR106]